jgi:zinc-ribbon domain
MHCPNCGTEAPVGQKFCRVCGLSLDRFAQLLAELLPDVEDENVAQARQRLRQLEKVGKIAGVIGALAILIFFTSVGIYVINTGNIGPGILLLVIGFSSIAALWLTTYYNSLHKKVSAQQPSQPAAPSAETTNKFLPEEQSQIAMSVTEQTTARLGEKIEPRG